MSDDDEDDNGNADGKDQDDDGNFDGDDDHHNDDGRCWVTMLDAARDRCYSDDHVGQSF